MPVVPTKKDKRASMDEAIERFLSEHLRDEKGREEKTIRDYRALHQKWFAPEFGRRPVRDVDRASLDRAFGKMRRAGLSRSRLNQAKSLYAPFFKWARNRGLTTHNPMAEFEVPTSKYVATERTPPEVEELCLLLREAVTVIPEVAPVLVLAAVTGMRRGELVGLRRSRIRWRELRITVDSAIDGLRVKTTKTRKERSFHVDEETIAMLARVCEQQDLLAAEAGILLALDPFVFSLAALWECWLVVDGPPLGVFGRGETAERRVRPVGVVLDAPRLGENLRFEEGGELLGVQQLAAHPAVEALDEGVLPRRSRARCRSWSYRPRGTSPAAPRPRARDHCPCAGARALPARRRGAL